ncbi:PAB1 binding protein [Tilletia horrida]|nr:PAB1 binding protein [Tilletia horrida]KAK0557769.1 PAB1 binding protein [Tilletia horrida]
MTDKTSAKREPASTSSSSSTAAAAATTSNVNSASSSSNTAKRPRSTSHASTDDGNDPSSSNGDGPSKRIKEEHGASARSTRKNTNSKMSADNEHNTHNQDDEAVDLGPASNGAGKDGDNNGAPSAATVLSAAATGPSDKVGEDGEGDGSMPMQMISMRALIITSDASIIIGKSGKHINEIRDKSGARLNISETVAGNPERILTVSGQLDAVSKAFGLIVRRINDEPFDQPSVPGSRAVTIRFIVPNSRMGSVIGKSGSKIKEIQEASGARLTAGEQMLPGSTERVLSISGVADAVHIAVYYVGTILLEHQERNLQNTSYRPTQAGPSQLGARGQGAHSHPRGGPAGFGGGVGVGAGAGAFGTLGGGLGAPVIAAAGGLGAAAGAGGAPLPPGSQTQQIFIPNDLVGCIIGKGGSKINEIRQMSGSHIKIMEPGAGAAAGGTGSERLVMITGPPANIQMAVTLLYQRLEQEKMRMAQPQ